MNDQSIKDRLKNRTDTFSLSMGYDSLEIKTILV